MQRSCTASGQPGEPGPGLSRRRTPTVADRSPGGARRVIAMRATDAGTEAVLGSGDPPAYADTGTIAGGCQSS